MNKRIILKIVLPVLILLLMLPASTVFADKIIYVDDDAAAGGDSTSWATAYKFLQDALSSAAVVAGTNNIEIRVAQGIYKPDQGAGQIPGNKEASFQLINGVTLAGGYAGLAESDPNKRDYERYETILSGDLAGNDVDVNKPVDLFNEPTREDNSYHVVTGTATDETAIVKGFTITGGNASSGNSLRKRGGGIYCGEKSFAEINGGPTIMQCTIKKNIAHSHGGGISDCRGTISECVITENAVSYLGGGLYNCAKIINSEITYNTSNDGSGGGLCSCDIINHCIVSHNYASNGGGGLSDCDLILGSIVSYNYAEYSGGGIVHSAFGLWGQVCECTIYGNNADNGAGIAGCKVVSNCLITGNSAKDKGGGLFYCSNLINCTISFNRAKNLGGGFYGENVKIIANNTILWGNSAAQGNQTALSGVGVGGPPGVGYFYYGTISFQHSNVQGGDSGIYKEFKENIIEWNESNIDVDPLFASPGYWDPNGTPGDPNDDFWIEGDYHLKSQAGRWDPASGSWVLDDVTSPCIDAGDPNNPIGLEPFPNGGRINMGAYGGTTEAGKSYFGEPVCETIVAGDINGDCRVDFKDIAILTRHWLRGESTYNHDM